MPVYIPQSLSPILLSKITGTSFIFIILQVCLVLNNGEQIIKSISIFLIISCAFLACNIPVSFISSSNFPLYLFSILTDESCNFKFYENCGCEKIYETIVKNQEYGKLGNISSEKAFIYEKRL